MNRPRHVSSGQRWLALVAGFLGWMFAGLEISSFALVTRPAVLSMSATASDDVPNAAVALTDRAALAERERDAKRWLSWYQSAFLFGAAAGGWLFGWVGDRFGRAKSLGVSILTYSLVTGVGCFVTAPEQLLVVRFVSCLGVGGTWPAAVALVSEVWSEMSRPLVAGLLGMAANCGFVLLGLIGCYKFIEVDAWRWVLLVGACPAALGAVTLWTVREPARWLAARQAFPATSSSIGEVLRPPFLRRTLLGSVLGAVAIVGTAVNAVWIVPWSDQVATQDGTTRRAKNAASKAPSSTQADTPTDDERVGWRRWLPRYDHPQAKAAWTQVVRSSGAALGSLIGGWLASRFGRRAVYFAISLTSLAVSGYLYGFLDPTMPLFPWFAFALGFVGVTYFGWLPLYLPELFPTRIRATGSGVTFNSGRAVAAVAALALAGWIQSADDLDYAQIGLWTSGIYAVGLVAILFAPDTSKKGLED